VLPLAEAARLAFPVREVTEDETRALGFGQRIAATGAPGLHAAIGGGHLVALIEDAGDTARVAVGFPPS
jgi:tRNA pseudouridine55 synthase